MKNVETGIEEISEPPVLVVLHSSSGSGLGAFGPILQKSGLCYETVVYADGDLPRRPIDEYAGAIVMGGRPQVDQEARYPWLRQEKRDIERALNKRLPLLGVCLGGQLIAEACGAHVGPARVATAGWGEVRFGAAAADDPLFGGTGGAVDTVLVHSYAFELPPGASALAWNEVSLQAFRLDDAPVWGTQFHPEVSAELMVTWLDRLLARGELTSEQYAAELAKHPRVRERQARLGAQICGRFLDIVGKA
ncbi:type 1 glutamine amidotransferase [Nocardia pseudovaccinii]|uniref:type 1 glutamine amidotransferase n=1 Tax=Nocardia pseudovaccinii TaxID=189540 RepID=UPI003D8B5567